MIKASTLLQIKNHRISAIKKLERIELSIIYLVRSKTNHTIIYQFKVINNITKNLIINNKTEQDMDFEKSFGTFDLYKLAKWVTHDDGGEFLIAPLNNNKQLEETMKLTKVNEDVNSKTLYETKELSCKVLSKSVLIDWKHITDAKGKQLKYSSNSAESILLNYNEFTDWVIAQSKSLVDEKEESKAEEVKK